MPIPPTDKTDKRSLCLKMHVYDLLTELTKGAHAASLLGPDLLSLSRVSSLIRDYAPVWHLTRKSHGLLVVRIGKRRQKGAKKGNQGSDPPSTAVLQGQRW